MRALFSRVRAVWIMWLLLGSGLVAGCAPQPGLLPFDGPVDKVQTVFMATSRNQQAAREEDGTRPEFGSGRGQELHFGRYDMSVPPDRDPGALALPTAKADPARDFLMVGSERYQSEAAFIAAVNRALAPLPPAKRHVTLYVHGYRASFAESVLNTAQLAADYHLPGPVVLFAWPSADQLTHYLYDRDSTLYSRDQFVRTLKALTKTRATEVNVIAHSMGGFLVMEGLNRLVLNRDRATLNRINGVLLAEPDISIDVFRSQIAGLDLNRLDLAVMVSGRDRALQVSSLIAGGTPRLGERRNLETLRRLGVYVVDLSQFNDGTLIGHTAFQNSPELVSLFSSGRLVQGIEANKGGDNIAVQALNTVGNVTLLIAYLPYRLTGQ